VDIDLTARCNLRWLSTNNQQSSTAHRNGCVFDELGVMVMEVPTATTS
jgi:hypothetical protein